MTMVYVLPQVQVFQDFSILPAAAANPMSAHIAGGHAHLVRVAEVDEKQFGHLGLYDDAVDTDYLWPNRPAGAIVDSAYTRLFMENALLRYLALDTGDNVVVKSSNRVSCNTTTFKTTPGHARDSLLLDRDVQVGDVVRVRGVPTNGDGPVTLWTHVRALIPKVEAGVVGSATTDSNNVPATNGSFNIDKLSGPDNCVLLSGFTSNYNGVATGDISETYTITVLESSVGGDLSTARLRVVSASGRDNVASLAPATIGNPTAIGTRGLNVIFIVDDGSLCSQNADTAGVSPDDLIAGQTWRVTVTQDFTKSTVVSGGTYNKSRSTTYIVTVSKGGKFANGDAEIFVTTTNGIDQSGPHVVTNHSVAVNIGTSDVTIMFGSTVSLCKGDRFYIEVTGTANGAVQTIELATSLDPDFAVNDEVSLDLFIRKPLLEIPANRTNEAPLVNWSQSETEISVFSGLSGYDSEWTDEGVPQALPVFSSASLGYGNLFVQYRAWLATLTNQVGSITDVANIDDIAGPLTPDNPLKWGVFKALSNSNGTPVLYTAVADPNDPNTWDEALEATLTRDDVYGMVPLTRNATVLSAYAAHVNSASAPGEGLWRVAWFNLQGIPEIPIVSAGGKLANYMLPTTTDGEEALGTFTDDPETSGSQYTILSVPANNAAFLTNGVRVGDIVRALYTGDGFGNELYTEFVVDELQSENQLRLKVGPGAPQTVPAKFEIWRTLSRGDEASAIARTAGAWSNRRIRAIWPDVIESAGTLQEGYHLCAALAGLASGVLPQQGLTNVSVAGFSNTARTDRFSKAQLDIMAGSGTWIVKQAISGEIYNRHALTTGNYADINEREEMLTRNVDSISYRFKDYFAPYIGRTNVTPTMALIIKGGITKLIRVLQSERFTAQLGGQLIDATLVSFDTSQIFADRYVVYLQLQVPYALNNIELHLVV